MNSRMVLKVKAEVKGGYTVWLRLVINYLLYLPLLMVDGGWQSS